MATSRKHNHAEAHAISKRNKNSTKGRIIHVNVPVIFGGFLIKEKKYGVENATKLWYTCR